MFAHNNTKKFSVKQFDVLMLACYSQPMDFFHGKFILAHCSFHEWEVFPQTPGRSSGIHQFLFLEQLYSPCKLICTMDCNFNQHQREKRNWNGKENRWSNAHKLWWDPAGNKRLLWSQQVSLWLGDKARRVQWKNPHGRMSHRCPALNKLTGSLWSESRGQAGPLVSPQWLLTASTRVDGENIRSATKWRPPTFPGNTATFEEATLESKDHLLLFCSDLAALTS